VDDALLARASVAAAAGLAAVAVGRSDFLNELIGEHRRFGFVFYGPKTFARSRKRPGGETAIAARRQFPSPGRVAPRIAARFFLTFTIVALPF
jgi:hypothetical protein